MAAHLKLTTQTVHLAIKLLDHFMSGHDIKEPQLYLVCLGCLQLASKIHENESNVPRGSLLMRLLPHPLSLTAFRSLEYVMLEYFQWDICLPTSCCLTELLLPLCLPSTSDKQHGKSVSNFQTAKIEFLHMVKVMMDLSLHEDSMMLVAPSIMACAILNSSRIVSGIQPGWPNYMKDLTGVSTEELETNTDNLISLHKFYREDDEMEIVDEGYHSNNSLVNSPEIVNSQT